MCTFCSLILLWHKSLKVTKILFFFTNFCDYIRQIWTLNYYPNTLYQMWTRLCVSQYFALVLQPIQCLIRVFIFHYVNSHLLIPESYVILISVDFSYLNILSQRIHALQHSYFDIPQAAWHSYHSLSVQSGWKNLQ